MELVRMFLVLGHLTALMAAAIAVAFGDYALLGRSRVQTDLMHRSSQAVAWALAGLWLTGLGIIYVDTQFALVSLMAKPKLLAKLTVVLVLTANGFLLHARVLPALSRLYEPLRAQSVARLAAVAGGVSAAGWVFGLFLGVAKPLAPILQYKGFIALYVLVVTGALLVARKVVAPQLADRLAEGGAPTPVFSTERVASLAALDGDMDQPAAA